MAELTEEQVASLVNQGKLDFKKIASGLKAEISYARIGKTYRLLIKDGPPVEIAGKLANVYMLGSKVDRAGNEVMPKPRKPSEEVKAVAKAPKTEAPKTEK